MRYSWPRTQRFPNREKRVKHQFLGDNPQSTTCLSKIGLHIRTMDRHMAPTGSGKAREYADECRFSGAVGAQKAKELARLDVKRHALQGLEFASGSDVCLGYVLK